MISEDVGILVTTRDEKTAPPKNARLQKGHCMIIFYFILKKIVFNAPVLSFQNHFNSENGPAYGDCASSCICLNSTPCCLYKV